MKIKETFEKDEVKVESGQEMNRHTIPLQNGNYVEVKFNLVHFERFGFREELFKPEDEEDYEYYEDYTFRYYGKLKDFSWYFQKSRKMTYLITKRSYIRKFREAPFVLLEDVTKDVNEGRVYELYLGRSFPLTVALVIHPVHTRDIVVIARKNIEESFRDYERLLENLGEADVIGIHAEVDFSDNLLIRVDDRMKVFLDKLIIIYTRLSKYLTEYDIPLGTVLDNIDLYHCLSYGV